MRRQRALLAGVALLVCGVTLAVVLVFQRGDSPAGTAAVAESAIERGERVYLQQCLSCHGANGESNPTIVATLGVRPADLVSVSSHGHNHGPEDFFAVIRDGIPGSKMPGFGDDLSYDEIWDTIAYISRMRPNGLILPLEMADPADCTVEPRGVESFGALATELGEVPATRDSIVWPSGTEGDPGLIGRVERIAQMVAACVNAGDSARLFALFSDRRAAELAVIAAGMETQTDEGWMEGNPRPVDERISIRLVREVRTLSDGRVGAIVDFVDPQAQEQGASLYIFVVRDDRLLLDEVR